MQTVIRDKITITIDTTFDNEKKMEDVYHLMRIHINQLINSSTTEINPTVVSAIMTKCINYYRTKPEIMKLATEYNTLMNFIDLFAAKYDEIKEKED